MLDPERYYPQDNDTLTARLVIVCCQLGSLHRELSLCKIEERKKREAVWWGSSSDTVAARNREADNEALTEWIAVQELTAQIAEYEVERDLLKCLLNYNT